MLLYDKQSNANRSVRTSIVRIIKKKKKLYTLAVEKSCDCFTYIILNVFYYFGMKKIVVFNSCKRIKIIWQMIITKIQ